MQKQSISFTNIPTLAFLNEKISYEAAVVFSELIKLKPPIITKELNLNIIRSHMRGFPSNTFIHTCLDELIKEGYITEKIESPTGRQRPISIIKICDDLKNKFNHLKPRR